VQGRHILAELRQCIGAPSLMCDALALAALCRAVCQTAGLMPVAEAFHQFPESGATGAVVLAESHLAIHTWPELGAVTLDLYVCNFSQDNRLAAETAFDALVAAFAPGNIVRRDVARGEIQTNHPGNAGMR
jgi:S-adenosylmethionine decarboxylase proenzyme